MGGGNSALSISVLTENISSKGLVTGGYLDNGVSMGVTVTNTSGGNYDNTAYNNIQFTSSGTGSSQKWSGGTVKLSATDGYCYAYYPYSSSATSLTAIPVTAGGTDYMYAERVTVNDKDKNATFNMKHALAAIRFALKKGTYAGTGVVTAVSVTSSALGSTGTLNAKTGEVTAASLGTAVSQSASFNLATETKNVDVVMVPSGSAGAITLSVTIDGKVYSTEVTSTTIKQGSCYTYTITVDAGALSLSGVKVGDWGYSDNGAPVITAGGYTVTFDGDYEDIAFSNSVSGSSITIEAYAKNDYNQPNAVTASGTATITQSVSDRLRTIILTGISSNITVTFAGTADARWVDLSDGVYAIDNSGEPVDYATANAAASGTYKSVAFVIKGRAYQVAKVNATGYDGSSEVYWHKTGYGDISGLQNFTNADATNGYGYIDGTGSPQLSRDPSTWTAGALSDFNGKENTEIIIAAQTTEGVVQDYTIGKAVMDFRNGSNNEGYNDWFVPSCGELAYMLLKQTELNTLLVKVSGARYISSNVFWSSSEYNSVYAWHIDFSNGIVYDTFKGNCSSVRLVRAI